MNSALTIAAVTAALKRLLENELVASSVAASVGGDVAVSAVPPDRIATGADERSQLNLFLYQLTPNTAMRSPTGSVADTGTLRHTPPRLALDLSYLVTAYGAHDFQTEILLGLALRLFHDTSVLDVATLGAEIAALACHDGMPAAPGLARAGTYDRVQQVKLVPQFLGVEELSRLWSALQARYRPSATYKVSMVVIDGNG